MTEPFFESFDAEFARREKGPICALCQHSPLEVEDLPPLGPMTYREAMKQRVRRFFCEPRRRMCTADDGRNCDKFAMKQ